MPSQNICNNIPLLWMHSRNPDFVSGTMCCVSKWFIAILSEGKPINLYWGYDN
jgi:hypothetical protein